MAHINIISKISYGREGWHGLGKCVYTLVTTEQKDHRKEILNRKE